MKKKHPQMRLDDHPGVWCLLLIGAMMFTVVEMTKESRTARRCRLNTSG